MQRTTFFRSSTVLALFLATMVSACSKESKPASDETEVKTPAAAPAVTPTGRIITIEAYSDGAGNYFKPTSVEAHRGDVVRFILKSGVHNVNFLADSNPNAKYLPPVSDMLQLPDQAYDVLIAMDEGRYYFQCDPHALLGMVGHIKVEN